MKWLKQPSIAKITDMSVENIVSPGEGHNVLYLDSNVPNHVHVSDEFMEKNRPKVGDYYHLKTQQIIDAKS